MTLVRDRHLDLWNKRKFRKKKSHIYITLIYDRGGELYDQSEN